MIVRLIVICVFAAWWLPFADADERAVVSNASTVEDGALVHDIESPFQGGKTQIRILLPSSFAAGTKLPVVYVLPVEPGRQTRYGDGLDEIQRHKLPEKHQAIFVAPTFTKLPWYADHSSDQTMRQESHLLNVVLPFVEQNYPALAESEGRLLLGFSKSGWGAWSLLLRHPETFGRAAAWDAPLMMDELGKYGTAEIFGTPTNFEAYRITDLLRAKATTLGQSPRLVLTGYGNFREHHQQTHALLDECKIPHVYRDGPQRKHDWHSGWVAEAVELLFDRKRRE